MLSFIKNVVIFTSVYTTLYSYNILRVYIYPAQIVFKQENIKPMILDMKQKVMSIISINTGD
jgi:hypothetical protein